MSSFVDLTENASKVKEIIDEVNAKRISVIDGVVLSFPGELSSLKVFTEDLRKGRVKNETDIHIEWRSHLNDFGLRTENLFRWAIPVLVDQENGVSMFATKFDNTGNATFRKIPASGIYSLRLAYNAYF